MQTCNIPQCQKRKNGPQAKHYNQWLPTNPAQRLPISLTYKDAMNMYSIKHLVFLFSLTHRTDHMIIITCSLRSLCSSTNKGIFRITVRCNCTNMKRSE